MKLMNQAAKYGAAPDAAVETYSNETHGASPRGPPPATPQLIYDIPELTGVLHISRAQIFVEIQEGRLTTFKAGRRCMRPATRTTH